MKGKTRKIILNLLAMMGISLILIWLASLWLGLWTRHGHTVEVPSVRTLSYDQAIQTLEDQGLTVILSDSVYDTRTAPGTVIDQNPKQGTIVKEGREIYLTINAFSPKMISLPTLTDISVRQARSILEGLEIKNITERRVPSDFKDLVLAVRYRGNRLMPGARVPINARIELEVGEGFSNIEQADSAASSEEIDSNEILNLF